MDRDLRSLLEAGAGQANDLPDVEAIWRRARHLAFRRRALVMSLLAAIAVIIVTLALPLIDQLRLRAPRPADQAGPRIVRLDDFGFGVPMRLTMGDGWMVSVTSWSGAPSGAGALTFRHTSGATLLVADLMHAMPIDHRTGRPAPADELDDGWFESWGDDYRRADVFGNLRSLSTDAAGFWEPSPIFRWLLSIPGLHTAQVGVSTAAGRPVSVVRFIAPADLPLLAGGPDTLDLARGQRYTFVEISGIDHPLLLAYPDDVEVVGDAGIVWDLLNSATIG